MRKEVLIAIVLGFGLGLLITFGVWQANKKFQPNAASTEEITPTQAASPAPEQPSPTPEESMLTIESPENNLLTDQDEVELIGLTQPEAIIVVFYEEGETILEAKTDGTFSTLIPLVVGENEIRIKAIDANNTDEAEEKILSLVYSSVEI